MRGPQGGGEEAEGGRAFVGGNRDASPCHPSVLLLRPETPGRREPASPRASRGSSSVGRRGAWRSGSSGTEDVARFGSLLPRRGPRRRHFVLRTRPSPTAQARLWRREIPACDARGGRGACAADCDWTGPGGGRGRLLPHFSAFPNCGRWEGAGSRPRSATAQSREVASGRCGRPRCGTWGGRGSFGEWSLHLNFECERGLNSCHSRW